MSDRKKVLELHSNTTLKYIKYKTNNISFGYYWIMLPLHNNFEVLGGGYTPSEAWSEAFSTLKTKFKMCLEK